MKTKSLLLSLVVACGGVGDTTIDGGGTDSGGGGDTATPTDSGSPTDTGTTTDSSTPNDAGNDTGTTFNVSAVNGLVLWLEGNVATSITQLAVDGGTPSVTVWADQTSHKNDAKGLATANGVVRNPSVKTGGIHGLDVIHFNQGTGNVGNMLTIADNTDTSLQWGTGDFYVAVVGDFDNDPTKGANEGVGNFFSKLVASSGQTPAIGATLYGNVPATNTNPTTGLIFITETTINNFVSTSTAYNNSTAHEFAIRRQGTTLDLFVDGTSIANTTSTGIDVSNVGTSVRIGADGDATLVRLDGDIGEMIAVKGVLSPSDQTGIDGYLKAKWGTP